MDTLFGRDAECRRLDALLDSKKAEFIAIYGRRRVGKTFLIDEYLKDKIAFKVSGVLNQGTQAQKSAFRIALDKQGYPEPTEQTWMDMFYALQKLLQSKTESDKPCVLFIDELPCFDVARSGFIPALDHFWNTWASKYHNIKLIVCGSATSWMIDKLINNHGGLYNRVTAQIHLHPFTLKQTEDYFKSRNIKWNRLQITQFYMFTGGIPYYLSLVGQQDSVPQAIDNLYFHRDAPLQREYNHLMASLYNSPEPYTRIIDSLVVRKQGMSREEISRLTGIPTGGRLTKMLQELEESDFIRSYFTREKKIKQNNNLYQLCDMFCSFHLFFRGKGINDDKFWENNINTPLINTWYGFAFERVVMQHIDQIKQSLSIAGMSVNYYAWRSRTTEPKSQIDLILDRADNIVNLCEIKYSKTPYSISKEEDEKLFLREQNFVTETNTKQGVHLTLITPFGVNKNSYWSNVSSEVTLDGLFER
ncbi:MAG: AAA family ATPase [Prevotella sp.]|nr:AAA family ATPase [Prevotella sp.]